MAETHIRSMVKISYRYWMSLKNTNSADKIKPTPILKRVRVIMGYARRKKRGWKCMPLIATNKKKIISVRAKLTKDDMFLDNKNKYLGTLTLVKIPLLAIKDCIPKLVDSLKNRNTFRPAKTCTTKCSISRPKKCWKTSTITRS
jgi:hypothetical protein